MKFSDFLKRFRLELKSLSPLEFNLIDLDNTDDADMCGTLKVDLTNKTFLINLSVKIK